MNKKVRAILKTMLDDIRSDNPEVNQDVADTLNNIVVRNLLLLSGCPESVLKAMDETVSLSPLERRYCCKQIMSAIKKPPPRDGQGF